LFDGHMPPLGSWLARFALPSLASLIITCVLLYATQRKALSGGIYKEIHVPALQRTGRMVACGIGFTALSLMAASLADAPLGWPTFTCGAVLAAMVTLMKREMPWDVARRISWGVLPLVAGLFVLVEGLNHIHAVDALGKILKHDANVWNAGIGIAFICNLMNNLPAGLIAGMTVTQAHLSESVTNALLVGVDLGPNLSVTGSLATILWLTALRREGEHVTAWQFLKLGGIVMLPALLGALAFL